MQVFPRFIDLFTPPSLASGSEGHPGGVVVCNLMNFENSGAGLVLSHSIANAVLQSMPLLRA